jgi:hypothetical protein
MSKKKPTVKVGYRYSEHYRVLGTDKKRQSQ